MGQLFFAIFSKKLQQISLPYVQRIESIAKIDRSKRHIAKNFGRM